MKPTVHMYEHKIKLIYVNVITDLFILKYCIIMEKGKKTFW